MRQLVGKAGEAGSNHLTMKLIRYQVVTGRVNQTYSEFLANMDQHQELTLNDAAGIRFHLLVQ